MKDFSGKVAVVTGAASGIGRAMAERFAAEGMKIVLADIEQEELAKTESEMQTKGATVLAVQTDVSKSRDVESLAEKTLNSFGAVHLLCNNAGVGVSAPRPAWEHTPANWKWILGVNLWGVIHGIRVFVPIMLDQDTECHIVNTASMGGLFSLPFLGIYSSTKHSVVTFSEVLHRELLLKRAKIKVSVLCPGVVKTRIGQAERNRPKELQNPSADEASSLQGEIKDLGSYFSALYESKEADIRKEYEEVILPEQVADRVFEAVREDRFYIITHPRWKDCVRTRMKEILEERNPDVFI
ncbi:SDR family NAD(P)-dependent oxidoreductase [Candidatus Poribacteria bacterium]